MSTTERVLNFPALPDLEVRSLEESGRSENGRGSTAHTTITVPGADLLSPAKNYSVSENGIPRGA